MKYSKSPNYENNNKNHTYVVLKKWFNFEDDSMLFINLYGNTKVRINNNVVKVYESAYEEFGNHHCSMQVNQDYFHIDIDIDREEYDSEWFQKYLKALIYNDQEYSFRVLCDSYFSLQLFYSKLTESLLNRLSKCSRRYSDCEDKSELCLVGDHFWLSISLKYSFKPRIEINGLDYSLLSDDFINIIGERV